MTGAEFGGVDIDLLADYIGGALEGTPDETAVAALIADDPRWRAAYESLGGGMTLVQTELGRFEPEPMPADLAARLDGMFSAPTLTLVKGDAAAPAPKSRRRRWTTPIAIAAGFIAFVGFGADYLSGRSGSQSDESVSSTAADSGGLASAAGATILSSGMDYSRATLTAEPLPRPLAANGESSSVKGEDEPGEQARTAVRDPALARLLEPDALQECFNAIEQENSGGVLAVQTVDYARFNGVPALIVRFTAADGDWVWAVGADCGTPAGDADAIDRAPVR